MDWRDIPSLAALRGFEAAARLGSLSAAARELNVTHAAVAQNVRLLEAHFGCPLLRREGRGMAPTAEGTALAAGLAEGFRQIAAAVRDLAPDPDRPLRIAMTPSFAENWLMPVIGRFWSAHPEIRLELIPGVDLVDLRADGIDLAIRYGRGGWSGTDPQPLVAAEHVVVAKAGLFDPARIRSLGDLSDQHWVMERVRPEERLWVKERGLDLSGVRLTEVELTNMAVQAARSGAAVAILPSAVIGRDVAEGRLDVLDRAADTTLAYHLVRRPGRAPDGLETFVRWLRRVAADG